jgi:uncharacterized membrane protein
MLGHKALVNQLNAWKLLPVPERVTELYFTSPNSVPTTYAPGQGQTVIFTVQDLEYRTTTYDYTITQLTSDGSASQALATGSFMLAQNQAASEAVPVTPSNLGSRSQIEVKISFDDIVSGADKPSLESENIDYWVNQVGLKS